jgi:hypothetical protein
MPDENLERTEDGHSNGDPPFHVDAIVSLNVLSFPCASNFQSFRMIYPDNAQRVDNTGTVTEEWKYSSKYS